MGVLQLNPLCDMIHNTLLFHEKTGERKLNDIMQLICEAKASIIEVHNYVSN